MRRSHYTITPKAIQDHAVDLCRKHLGLKDHGPKCTVVNLLNILLYAASRLYSLAAACASLANAPRDTAVRAALLATLPDLATLQKRLSRSLQGDLSMALRRRRQPLAIDLTLLPYHGLPMHEDDEIYRGQAKSGTTHFHAYATAYVMRKGQRFTVALVYVRHGDDMADIVRELLRQAAKAGIRPRHLLLDRGFYSVNVVRYLQAACCPFLMPVPAKGRKADHAKGPSGTRVFHLQKKSGWSRHTLTNSEGRKATIQICVRCRNLRGERKRHGRQALVYGYWGLKPSSWLWVSETYRLRFGIETTYRQLHQALIPTCTRDPLLRLLYVGIALLLRNVWVWLHWEVLSEPHKGGRRVNLNRMVFRMMLNWLQHLVGQIFGFCDEMQSKRPMPA